MQGLLKRCRLHPCTSLGCQVGAVLLALLSCESPTRRAALLKPETQVAERCNTSLRRALLFFGVFGSCSRPHFFLVLVLYPVRAFFWVFVNQLCLSHDEREYTGTCSVWQYCTITNTTGTKKGGSNFQHCSAHIL